MFHNSQIIVHTNASSLPKGVFWITFSFPLVPTLVNRNPPYLVVLVNIMHVNWQQSTSSLALIRCCLRQGFRGKSRYKHNLIPHQLRSLCNCCQGNYKLYHLSKSLIYFQLNHTTETSTLRFANFYSLSQKH